MSSQTASTFAPSRVIRRAMMRPMSPEPRMTARFPGSSPLRLTNFWAAPAVYTPAGRVPGMPIAPRGRSRQPIARMTARARSFKYPSRGLTAVTIFAPSFSVPSSRTIVSSRYGMPFSTVSRAKRAAYSGPVSSSRKRWSPKPLWMHCSRMPPSCGSRSRMRISRTPCSWAARAAAIPAGPPPIITKSS